MKITGLLLGLFAIILISTISYANASPSPNLRVLIMDPEGSLGGGGGAFSVDPTIPFIFPVTEQVLNNAERIATFGGDLYVANVDKISRIDLNSTGLPDPDSFSNLHDITGTDFVSLTGIALDSSGFIYVADADDNTIYVVNPAGAPSAARTPLSPTFTAIRDITIDNDILYVLDSGGDGSIFKIDTSSPSTASLIYSGIIDGPALSLTNSIAVRGNEIFVSGQFDSGPEILKIVLNPSSPPTVTELFDNSLPTLSFPFGLVIDTNGKDLYVTDSDSLYSISLDAPLPPSSPIISGGSLSAPSGLAILVTSGSSTIPTVSVVKTVNATNAMPGDALLYTITITNDGSIPAVSLSISDIFPNVGANIVESFTNPSTNQLSFTSQFHDASAGGAVTDVGQCVNPGGDTLKVDCTIYPILDEGDFVIVTLEGIIGDNAVGTLVNSVQATFVGAQVGDTIETTVNPETEFLITKTASTNSVLAGDDSIDYVITIENSDPTAENVIITDTLPNGVTIVESTIPTGCHVTDVGGSSTLECDPITILNGDMYTITYTTQVDSNATNPLENLVSVTCPTCASGQTYNTTTTVNRESDLFLEKSANTTEVIAGQDLIEYTIFVTNNGPSDAANVVIIDTLPEGVTLLTISGCDSYDLQNNILTCNIESIPSGSTNEIIIDAAVDSNAVDPLVNTASVSSDSFDPELGDNDDSNSIQVIQEADMIVTKTGPPKTVAGRIINYTFTVTNIGSSDAEEVVVTDELQAGFTFVPSTDPSCHDLFLLGTVTCEFGTVGAGQTQIKSIQVQIGLTVSGNIQNTAEVSTSTSEDTDNNLSTIIIEVAPPFCGRAESDFVNVINGTAGNDHIKGTNDDDLIFGLDGNDKIHGKNGNDCIIGGDGDDKIWGGKGDDGIEGNAGNDRIHGQQGNDTLSGGDGDDRIYGGQGNDVIDAGTGNDKVHANQGDDTVTGGDGNDWLGAGIGNDVVSGGAGNDKIFGRPGNDILNGDDGHDYIHGGQGNGTANGGNGNDKIFGQQGHDILNGNDNDDYIHGGQGDDEIDGGAGENDKCNGAQGHNTIINCEVEDKKMKEEHEEDDDDEGESEDYDDDDEDDDDKKDKKDKEK